MRVLLRQNGALRRLANVSLGDRDGSVVLVLPRAGKTIWQQVRVPYQAGQPTVKLATEEVGKGVKVTLHSSGRLNFGDRRDPVYVEPIWDLTDPLWIGTYRIPTIGALDQYDAKVTDEDLVVDVPDSWAGPGAFQISLGPVRLGSSGVPTITFLNRLDLAFAWVQIESPYPSELPESFIYSFPERGTRATQAIPEDEALIRYSRLLYPPGFEYPMLDGPNGDGTYRLVFNVPMRDVPRVTIVAKDSNIKAVVSDQQVDTRTNKVQVKFRFRGKGGFIKSPTAFASIELDAEF